MELNYLVIVKIANLKNDIKLKLPNNKLEAAQKFLDVRMWKIFMKF